MHDVRAMWGAAEVKGMIDANADIAREEETRMIKETYANERLEWQQKRLVKDSWKGLRKSSKEGRIFEHDRKTQKYYKVPSFHRH